MPGPAETSDPTRQLRELVETGRFREALQEHQATRDPAIRHRPEANCSRRPPRPGSANSPASHWLNLPSRGSAPGPTPMAGCAR
jgi:hypothetical protein